MDDIVYKQKIFGMIFILAKKLQMLGDEITGDITLKQWFLINGIHNSNRELNYNELSDLMGTTRQNITKMVSALEKKGMVEVKPSKTDSRSVNIHLTEKSVEYFHNKEDMGNSLLSNIFEGFEKEEMLDLVNYLEKVLINTEMHLQKNS